MVCALVGVALLAGSLTPFLVIPAFAYLIDRRFIRAEEAMLEQTFGPQYADYTTRVGQVEGTLGGGLNGSYFLNASTVQDDGATDRLNGGPGQDLTFAGAGDKVVGQG